jgi:hypothetical protein
VQQWTAQRLSAEMHRVQTASKLKSSCAELTWAAEMRGELKWNIVLFDTLN